MVTLIDWLIFLEKQATIKSSHSLSIPKPTLKLKCFLIDLLQNFFGAEVHFLYMYMKALTQTEQ